MVEVHIETLLTDLMGDDSSLDGLKATLLARAEGNPLYIEESVRSLVETGALAGDRGAYRFEQKDAAVSLPDTIQAIIAQRIDRLPLAEKQLLQTASVIGTNVPLSLLQIVTERNHQALERGLDTLQSAEFLYETQLFPEIEYTFKHAHTHQVAYEGLLQEQRKNLHAQIGTAMQSLYPERRIEFAEKLAQHFEKGQVWDQAIAAYMLAAEKAKEKYAYETAVEYAQKVLTLSGSNAGEHDTQKADALALLGDVASLMDDLDAANAHYEQALHFAHETAHQQHIANRMHRQHIIYRDGAKIAYYSHGRGDRVLMLVSPVGYVQSTIQPIVERLCQEFRIITYDNRGLGASDPIVPEYPFRSQIEDARAVIEALDSGPVVLLGLSQSAALVARLAWMYPHLVSKLILVGLYVNFPNVTYQQSEEDRLYWAAVKKGDFSLHESYMERFVKHRFPEPDSRDLAANFLSLILKLPRNVWLSFVADDPDMDVTSLLSEIETPTLITYGSLEGMFFTVPQVDYENRLFELMPRAQFYVFENKGHLALYTAQHEFCDVLRRYMLTGKV